MFARFFTLGRLVAWALVPVALVVMGCLFSPDHLLLFPTRDKLSAIGATRRLVPFAGGSLEIWTGRGGSKRHASPLPWQVPPDVYILRFYGNADRADPNVGIEAGEWSVGTAEFWGMNYPGYGGSTGPATLARIGPAALAAFDALQSEAAGKPTLVFGTSIGTTAALHVAAHRPVTGLILQNPPPLRQIAWRQFGWWNLWLLAGPLAARIPAALDSVGNARATHAPAVFLLAEKDDIVRPKYQQLVVAAYAGEKRIVTQPGALHNDPLDGATQTQFNTAVTWLLARAAR